MSWKAPFISLQLQEVGAISNQTTNKQMNNSCTYSPVVDSLLEDLGHDCWEQSSEEMYLWSKGESSTSCYIVFCFLLRRKHGQCEAEALVMK